jgi:hypothetical protein
MKQRQSAKDMKNSFKKDIPLTIPVHVPSKKKVSQKDQYYLPIARPPWWHVQAIPFHFMNLCGGAVKTVLSKVSTVMRRDLCI